MSSLMFILAVLSCGGIPPSEEPVERPIEQAQTYVNQIAWRERPGALNQAILEGDVEFAVIYPDGRFAYLSGTAFREKDSAEFDLCQGCGFVVRTGTWRQKEGQDALEVRSAWTYLQRRFERSDQELREEEWVVSERSHDGKAAALSRKGNRFVPLSHFKDLRLLERCLQEKSVPDPVDRQEREGAPR